VSIIVFCLLDFPILADLLNNHSRCCWGVLTCSTHGTVRTPNQASFVDNPADQCTINSRRTPSGLFTRFTVLCTHVLGSSVPKRRWGQADKAPAKPEKLYCYPQSYPTSRRAQFLRTTIDNRDSPVRVFCIENAIQPSHDEDIYATTA